MQEEVTQKTIALSVKTARVTADVLKNMLRKYLSGQKQKGKNPYKVGKQSYKELKSQGSGYLILRSQMEISSLFNVWRRNIA